MTYQSVQVRLHPPIVRIGHAFFVNLLQDLTTVSLRVQSASERAAYEVSLQILTTSHEPRTPVLADIANSRVTGLYEETSHTSSLRKELYCTDYSGLEVRLRS